MGFWSSARPAARSWGNVHALPILRASHQNGLTFASEKVEDFVNRWRQTAQPGNAPKGREYYAITVRVRLDKRTLDQVERIMRDEVARGLSPRTATISGGEHVRRVSPIAQAAGGKREREQPIGGVGGAAMTRTHPRGLRDQAPCLLACPRDRQRSVAIRVRLPSETNILCPLRAFVPSRFNPSFYWGGEVDSSGKAGDSCARERDAADDRQRRRGRPGDE